MKFFVLTKNGSPVSIVFESPFPITDSELSAHTFDEPFPDLNISSWDSEKERFVVTSSQITKLMFLNRFTPQERISIRSSNDPIVEDIMALFDAASYVTTTDPNTIAGINYLASVGLITATRAQEILS